MLSLPSCRMSGPNQQILRMRRSRLLSLSRTKTKFGGNAAFTTPVMRWRFSRGCLNLAIYRRYRPGSGERAHKKRFASSRRLIWRLTVGSNNGGGPVFLRTGEDSFCWCMGSRSKRMYAKEEQARLAAHSHQRTRCQSRRRQLQVQSNGSKKQHMGRVCNLLSGSRAMGLSSSAHPQQGQLAMGE
jgi:hypothetical protein